MRPSGAVNPISVLLVAALLAAVYWAIVAGPMYLDNFTVREIAETTIPRAYQSSDEALVQDVVTRLNMNEVGWHREDDENGQGLEVPGLGVSAQNVAIERDEAAHHLRVTIRYSRDVRLVPTSKWTTIDFEATKEGTYQ